MLHSSLLEPSLQRCEGKISLNFKIQTRLKPPNAIFLQYPLIDMRKTMELSKGQNNGMTKGKKRNNQSDKIINENIKGNSNLFHSHGNISNCKFVSYKMQCLSAQLPICKAFHCGFHGPKYPQTEINGIQQ
jgi:hypothetical protein